MSTERTTLAGPAEFSFRPQMPEAYYETGLKLIEAERRAYAKARKFAVNARAWAAWGRASKRLTDHENEFGKRQ